MKAMEITILTGVCLLAAGCVSQKDYNSVLNQKRDLAYKLQVAERALNERDQKIADERGKHATTRQQIQDLSGRLSSSQRAIAASQAEAERARAEAEAARLTAENERQTRFDELARTMPEAEVSAYGGIILESGIYFRPGKHALQPAGKRALQPMITKLKSSDFAEYSIEIAGHTDADPIRHSKSRYTDNHILAANRANEVRRFLIQNGIAAGRLYLTAWGSERPLPGAPKAKNRRVELMLHKTVGPTTLQASAPR